MYHYGFLDRTTGDVIDVRYGTEADRKAIDERGGKEDIIIQPIMLRSQYHALPLDYSGEQDGKPGALYMDINGATVVGPVVIVDHWGKWSGEKYQTPAK
jgi:hypothetical protein